MYRMQLGLALAAAVGTGGWWTPAQDVRHDPPSQGTVAEPAETPRAPWLQGDPADSVYRAAREALNRRDYRKAADLFAQIPERFPRSGYAPDAFYWQAFALYRLGESPSFAPRSTRSPAARALPDAATKGDAAALEQRIQGELARRGDAAAAEEVTAAAAGRRPRSGRAARAAAGRRARRAARRRATRRRSTTGATTTATT